LECITHQSYENLEIIISDNCSDLTEVQTIVQEFVDKDHRITGYRQDWNGGVQSNYRFLADRATGKYLMFAQDDDWWSSQFIENLVKELESHPDIQLAACPSRYVNCETGKRSPVRFLDNLSVYQCVGNGSMGMAVMGVWRRDAYLKLEAREIPDTVSGVDHTAAALAILCGGIGVVQSEEYRKGFHTGRFGQAFSRDPWYSFRAWYYYVKTVSKHPSVPVQKKLLLPAIAITNLTRAGLITGVHLIVLLPPVNRIIQHRLFGTN
jgi:glycosyltransferase involved in cell wall biosynthesis